MEPAFPNPAVPERLAALHRYDILGSPQEQAFDRITDLAAHLLDAPMAGLHFIDASCQWAKAQVGIEAQTLDLELSFCVHGLQSDDVLIVEDATQDARFADNPLVTGPPGIRFYAGAPLVTPDGYVLGSLCVIDTAPRPEGLSPSQSQVLAQLAQVAMDELEYRAHPRYREEILESVTNAFLTVNDQWRLTYVNQRAEELIQHPRNELLGSVVWDVLPAMRDLNLHDQLQNAVRTEETTQFEAYIPQFDRWFQVTGYPFKGGISVYLDDVTALHEQRAQLEEERERVSMALTGADLGMWDLDLDTGQCVFDERWAAILGYTLDEVDPRVEFFESRVHPEDLQTLRTQFDRHIRGEIPHIDAEIRMKHKEGSWRWVLDRGKILEWNEDGSPRRVVGTHKDITERKEREKALRRERDLLQNIFDASPVAIVTLDAEGQFLTASTRARDILGLDPDDVLERAFNDPRWCITDANGQPIPDEELPFARVMASGERVYDAEHTIQWPDGNTRLLSVSGAPLTSPEGDPEGAVFIMNDVTERRQHEHELMAAKERAEEMNRLKNAFLANMSHEIRTPLTSIIGFADVLSGQMNGPEEELIQLIRQSGKRLEETLTAILDLAQLESNDVHVDPEPVNLSDAVRSAVGMHRPKARSKGLDVILHLPDEPVEMLLDARALQRILSHLVSNAVKFTDEGAVQVRLQRADEAVLLQVEDTGVGIGPDHLERIFSEFEQESKGYTRDYEGVGIGLAITRRLTKLLGGSIDVESEKGSGTVFTVRLPVEKASSASLPAARPAPPESPTQPRPTSSSAPPAFPSRNPASAKILLLDDNEMTRKVLPMLLNEADDRFVMDTAMTPDEALSAAREVAYDLFLIDINLSATETGIDVMHALRELPSHANTGMVACTAYAMPGDEEKFLEAGFDAYLAKPFRADELLAVIEAHCR